MRWTGLGKLGCFSYRLLLRLRAWGLRAWCVGVFSVGHVLVAGQASVHWKTYITRSSVKKLLTLNWAIVARSVSVARHDVQFVDSKERLSGLEVKNSTKLCYKK